MVLICGIPSESPIALVTNALRKLNYNFLLLNQRQLMDAYFNLTIDNKGCNGTITFNKVSYPLSEFTGAYIRMMDDTQLPELKDLKENDPILTRYQNNHNALITWMECADCNILNKYSAMASNNSKPYQAQIIRDCGFSIPETLITNNPDDLKAFQREYPSIIYKSISGVRSIVKELDEAAWNKINKIKNCPVQFQEKLNGYDVRVHVIGTECFGTAINTSNTDYRYVNYDREEYTHLIPFEPEDWVKEQCVSLTQKLGLLFAGIDLRYTTDGKVYCFEVNPSPGYSYYEKNTNQAISVSLAKFLSGK